MSELDIFNIESIDDVLDSIKIEPSVKVQEEELQEQLQEEDILDIENMSVEDVMELVNEQQMIDDNLLEEENEHLDNLSAKDIIKLANTKIEYSKEDILALSNDDLLNLSPNDRIYEFLTVEQKEFVQLENKKRFIMNSFGDDFLALMNKKGVTELLLDQNGDVWVEEFKVPNRYKSGIRYTKQEATRIIQLLSDYNGHTITPQTPQIDGVTPNDMRFSATLFQSTFNRPTFTIRKPSGIIIPRSQFIENGNFTKEEVAFIEKAIMKKLNIIFSGGTSSGKTTAINSFAQMFDGSSEHIYTIEDTPELQVSSKLVTRRLITSYITGLEILKQGMRFNPDRIWIGEIRDGLITREYLKALNSGHDGALSSTHASSCHLTLLKLEQFLDEIPNNGNHYRIIAPSVNVIVNVKKDEKGNRPVVNQIGVVKDYDTKLGEYIIEDIYGKPITRQNERKVNIW